MRNRRYEIYNDFYNLDLDYCLSIDCGLGNPFGFPIVLHEHHDILDLVTYLEDHKIGTRRLFAGNILRQPVMKKLPYLQNPTDGADYLMNKCIWIGCHPSLTNEMVDYMKEVLSNYGK